MLIIECNNNEFKYIFMIYLKKKNNNNENLFKKINLKFEIILLKKLEYQIMN